MATTDTSVTLVLGGDVTLPLFVDALTGLNDLLKVLSKEAGADSADWVIENLELGSTVAMIRGYDDDADIITQTTTALIENIAVVERGGALILDAPVARAARKLTSVLDGVVPFLSVSSGTEEVSIVSSDHKQGQQDERVKAFGSVTGVVRTLSRVRGLYFFIADETYGRIVPCRFAPHLGTNMADVMREIWDRRAVVEGIVIRDRRSGRPVSVSNVESVTLAPEQARGAFQRARGVLPVSDQVEAPEATIRRLRDAS
jgi:hypothetical protein